MGKTPCGPTADNLDNVIIKEAKGGGSRQALGRAIMPLTVSPNRCPNLHTHTHMLERTKLEGLILSGNA